MGTQKHTLDIKPVAGTIGAEVFGVDLSQPLSNGLFEAIHNAFLEHLVIFFPGQRSLTRENLKDFRKKLWRTGY